MPSYFLDLSRGDSHLKFSQAGCRHPLWNNPYIQVAQLLRRRLNTLRLPHVRDYIRSLIAEHLQDSSIVAVRTIRDLMTDARSDYVKLEAAKDVLDRAGFKPVDKHAHLHKGEVTVTIDLG